jgi:hypothetical protein
MVGDVPNASEASPVGPPGLRTPVPCGMWGQAKGTSPLGNGDPDRNMDPRSERSVGIHWVGISGWLPCPALALVADLSLAMRAARGENPSEGPWVVAQIRQSSLGPSIGWPIPLQRLGDLNVDGNTAWNLGL